MTANWKYGFLCDGAMQVAGKWTLQGLFDNIKAINFPAVHAECTLAAQFSAPVGAHVLRITCTDTNNQEIIPGFRMPIECKEFIENGITINVRSLVVPKPGFYYFKCYLDDDDTPFGTIEFQATKVEQSQARPRQEEI